MVSDNDEPKTLVETAGEIMQSEIDQANQTTADVIAAAGEAIDQAQEQAEEIARAAMETTLGRRVATIEEREATWRAELDELRRDLTTMRELVSELQATVSATATLTVATALAEPDPSLLIQPQSSNQTTMAEAVEQVTEVLPGSLSENTHVETVAPLAPLKKHRFL